MNILVTGGTGFVGTSLIKTIDEQGLHNVCVSTRQRGRAGSERVRFATVEEIGLQTEWYPLLSGIEAVIHLAARVHVMHDRASDPLEEFRRVNVNATVRLAQHAAASGVKRFVFVSSIKVNGESTRPGRPFTHADLPAPIDPYGISKYEAEQRLTEISRLTGMQLVIVRPPLLYGPGVKANFLNLMQLLNRGLPLPISNVLNQRSLCSVENLVNLLICCLTHPDAANKLFLVSDGEDVSTADLARRIAAALGRNVRLFPIPISWAKGIATALGRGAAIERLYGTLQVDISYARKVLGWTPFLTLDEGLRRTAVAYLKHGGAP